MNGNLFASQLQSFWFFRRDSPKMKEKKKDLHRKNKFLFFFFNVNFSPFCFLAEKFMAQILLRALLSRARRQTLIGKFLHVEIVGGCLWVMWQVILRNFRSFAIKNLKKNLKFMKNYWIVFIIFMSFSIFYVVYLKSLSNAKFFSFQKHSYVPTKLIP